MYANGSNNRSKVAEECLFEFLLKERVLVVTLPPPPCSVPQLLPSGLGLQQQPPLLRLQHVVSGLRGQAGGGAGPAPGGSAARLTSADPLTPRHCLIER